MDRTGIAGYSGSGKSTVARLLATDRAVIIDADAEAKKFIAHDKEVVSQLIAGFGPQIMEYSELNFSTLGRIVFSSKERLLQYNAIVHPPFLRELRTLFDRQTGHDVILDAALIPLWGIDSWFDTCIWVHASHAARLARMASRRRDLDSGSLHDRLCIQEEVMKEPSGKHWVCLPNEGNPEELALTVRAFHQKRPDAA